MINDKVKSSDLLCVTVADGKYTIKQDASGRLTALRHGESWRDCNGDGLVCALAHEVDSLREQLARVNHESKLDALANAINNIRMSFSNFVSDKRLLKQISAQGIGCESYRLDFTGFDQAHVEDAITALYQAKDLSVAKMQEIYDKKTNY